MAQTTGDGFSLLIPAWNEAGSLAQVLDEAESVCLQTKRPYEIVVCDDGSTDATLAIARAAQHRIAHLRVLTNPQNLGIRGTLTRLYAEARMPWVANWAADGEYPFAALLDLLPAIRTADIVVGRRRHKNYGWFRSLVSFAFNLVPPLLFGVRVHDAGSVKLMRSSVTALPSVSRTPFCEAERLIRARRAGYTITARPISVRPRFAGESGAIRRGTLTESIRDIGRVFLSVHRATGQPSSEPAAGRPEDPPR